MFIDFNGLPGCGKTTLSLCLVHELQKQGKSVLLFQDYIEKHNVSNLKTLSFFFRNLIKLHPAHFILFVRFLFCLPRKAPRKLYRWYLLLLNYFFYRNCVLDNPQTTVISEQCFIQELVSCYYDQPIQSNNTLILQLIKLLSNDYYAINAILSLKSVIWRLKERKNGESRLDKIDDSSLLASILSIQYDNIEFIRNCMKSNGMNTVDIDMEKEPDINVMKIFEYLNLGGTGS